MPISTSRVTALGASLVCRVDSTRWPVRAASTPSWAVARSRISPIMMMSGSDRRMAGRMAAKFRPALWLTCTWLMPSSRYSTGSSTVMMLTPGLLISDRRRVQRGRLARAGRAGDQHHPVRLAERAGEPAVVVVGEAELAQLQVDAAGVEHPQHDLLAPHGRQGGGPQVDVAAVEPDRDPAVLRQPPLGDVDVGHDLEPGDQRRLDAAGDLVDLVQHAVDAEPDPHVGRGRLQVQVGRAALDGLLDERVDVPDHRSVVAGGGQVGDVAVVLAGGGDHRAQVAVLALDPVDELAQLAAGGDDRPDGHPGGGAQVVQGHHVVGVADRDDELVVRRSRCRAPGAASPSASGILATAAGSMG